MKGKIIICVSSSTLENTERMKELVTNAGGKFAGLSMEAGADMIRNHEGIVRLGCS